MPDQRLADARALLIWPNGDWAEAGYRKSSRHALNAIREMLRRGGRAAINKVMKNQPAVFLKLLVLLVPREMRVEHKGGVKAMTDEQLEQGIEAITAMLAGRAGDQAQVIEAVPAPAALPAPSPRKTRRKVRKTDENMGESMGKDEEEANS